MNWKQVIITSAITLIITIISGITVNWYTKNSIEKNEPKNQLYYRVIDISEFKSDSTKLSLLTIEVSNKSNEKYTNVEFNIEFDENAQVIDVTSQNVQTHRVYEGKLMKNAVTFNYPILFQGEKIKINIAVENLGEKKLSLQSNEALGKEFFDAAKTVSSDNILIEIIVLSLVLMLFVFLLGRKLFGIIGSLGSLNNTAFLFLHSKHFQVAHRLLLNRIEKNGGNTIELSNLATVEYLLFNDPEKANSLLKMADYIATTKNSKFVLAFNGFIVKSLEKNYLKAKENLELCHRMNSRDLKRYIEFSLIINDISVNDQIIKTLIEDLN